MQFNCHNRNSTAHSDECCEQGDEEHNVSTAGIAATQSSLTNICNLQKSPKCSGVIHSVHDACITAILNAIHYFVNVITDKVMNSKTNSKHHRTMQTRKIHV